MRTSKLSVPVFRCSSVKWGCAALVALCGALLARATTVEPPTFEALVNSSDYIIRAKTKSVSAEKKTTDHGVKIVTHVELEILEVVGGAPPAQLTLQLLGGRVGDDEMIVEGMPRFHAGDEDILFVSGNGRTICPLYGMMHGRYSVRTDASTGRKYVTRANGSPLHDTAQIASPMAEAAATEPAQWQAAVATALGPTDFIRQIRSSIKPDARLNRAK